MDWAQNVITFLDNPIAKVVAVMLGTIVLRRFPRFVNQAASVWTGAYSVGMTLLHMMFPGQVPADAHNAAFATYVVDGVAHQAEIHMAGLFSGGGFLHGLLTDAIVPWLLGYGGHRTAAHSIQWATGNGDTGGDVPEVQVKPFQTVVPKR